MDRCRKSILLMFNTTLSQYSFEEGSVPDGSGRASITIVHRKSTSKHDLYTRDGNVN